MNAAAVNRRRLENAAVGQEPRSKATAQNDIRRLRCAPFCAAAGSAPLCRALPNLRLRQAQARQLELDSLGLIEAAEPPPPMGEAAAYEITSRGHAFANASAAKPVLRRTAESALRQFMGRLHIVNASSEYVYRVRSAVLFGSMLSDAERLGDVDIAIELSPKVDEEAEFRQWCDRRRHVAQEAGDFSARPSIGSSGPRRRFSMCCVRAPTR